MLRDADPAESPACALQFSHIRGEEVPAAPPGVGVECGHGGGVGPWPRAGPAGNASCGGRGRGRRALLTVRGAGGLLVRGRQACGTPEASLPKLW